MNKKIILFGLLTLVLFVSAVSTAIAITSQEIPLIIIGPLFNLEGYF